MDKQEKQRILFVGFTVILGLGTAVLSARFNQLGWKTAAGVTFLNLILLSLFAYVKKDGVVTRWLVFGIAAGFVELVADHWLVAVVDSLRYAPGEPLIWVSPFYMPFSWAVVLAQVGAVGEWIYARRSLWLASLLTATFGAFNISRYENFAHDAQWWSYHGSPMLQDCPHYIILGEFLLTLPLVWMTDVFLLEKRPLSTSLALGVLEGAIIYAAYRVAYWLVGPCEGAVIQLPCT